MNKIQNLLTGFIFLSCMLSNNMAECGKSRKGKSDGVVRKVGRPAKIKRSGVGRPNKIDLNVGITKKKIGRPRKKVNSDIINKDLKVVAETLFGLSDETSDQCNSFLDLDDSLRDVAKSFSDEERLIGEIVSSKDKDRLKKQLVQYSCAKCTFSTIDLYEIRNHKSDHLMKEKMSVVS